MDKQSIHKNIEDRIKRCRRGRIFFPADFTDLGGSETIKKTLLRLEHKGLLKRLGFGIYSYPKKSKLLGDLTPTLDDIATAIAERDKSRILPTDSYALNALGLTTQVPLNAVYITDGAARTIKVGNRSIQLKKTTSRNLSALGSISGLVIQALKFIGEGNVLPEQEKKVLAWLKKEKPENIVHDLNVAPEWIRKIMRKAISKKL